MDNAARQLNENGALTATLVPAMTTALSKPQPGAVFRSSSGDHSMRASASAALQAWGSADARDSLKPVKKLGGASICNGAHGFHPSGIAIRPERTAEPARSTASSRSSQVRRALCAKTIMVPLSG